MEVTCFSLLLLITTVTVHDRKVKGKTISCASEFVFEIDTRATLNCTKSDGYGYIYWYKGNDTTGIAIMWLENGNPGGSEYGKGEYNITSEGSLVIISTQLRHVGMYTLRVYFSGGTYDTTTLRVNVYITPNPPCPTINMCPSVCDKECWKKPPIDGELVCTINGARPKVNITWNVISQSGVDSVLFPPEHNHDEVSGRWHSSIKLTYGINICDGYAVFQCTASNTDRLQNRTITISNPATCDTPTTSLNQESEFRLMHFSVIVVIPVLLVCATLLLTGCFLYRRRGSGTGYRNDVHYADVPLMLTRPDRKRKRLSEEEIKKIIIEGLSMHYKKLLYIKPLPWDEPVLISRLYTSCKCLISSEKGDTKETNTEELFYDNFWSDNKRVLITADLGYGKTTFTKHVLDLWLKKNDGSVLIYTSLKDVGRRTQLCEVVLQMMPADSHNITNDDVELVFRKNKCHFLLDGLDEMSMSLEKQKQNQSCHGKPELDQSWEIIPSETIPDNCELEIADSDNSRVTVENLLNSKIAPTTCGDIYVWVTSREIDDSKNLVAQPFAKITFGGFNAKQTNEYIERACKYCSQFRYLGNLDNTEMAGNHDTEVPLLAVTSNGTVLRNEERLVQLVNGVKESLDMNEIIKEFSDTPLLLIMAIHIIASKISCPQGRMNWVNINKITTIVRIIITCLESRYFQKIGNEMSREEIEEMEMAIGRIAFTQKMGVTVMKKEAWDSLIGVKSRNTALAIGLLRFSKDVVKGISQIEELAFSSYTGVEFYHQFFQEYFAAQYVPTDKKDHALLEKFLEARTEDKATRYLQFMTGSNHKCTQYVFKYLVSKGAWNNLIDCLFEHEDEIRVKMIIEEISKLVGGKVWSRRIDVMSLERRYHQAALSSFCTRCRQHGISIREMSFRENCAITFLENCDLPALEILTFCKMKITGERFVTIIESIAMQTDTPRQIKFEQCTTPAELTESLKSKLKTAKKEKMKITAGLDTFNTATGEWENQILGTF